MSCRFLMKCKANRAQLFTFSLRERKLKARFPFIASIFNAWALRIIATTLLCECFKNIAISFSPLSETISRFSVLQHGGSILAYYPEVLGLILGVPKIFSIDVSSDLLPPLLRSVYTGWITSRTGQWQARNTNKLESFKAQTFFWTTKDAPFDWVPFISCIQVQTRDSWFI